MAEVAFPRGNLKRAKLVLTDELIAATAAERGVVAEDDAEAEPEAASPPPSKRN